jgi:hypothetical protein
MSWSGLPVASGNAKKLMQFCNCLWKFWADCYILFCNHCDELMESVGCNGSWLLLFMMKVVWYFLSYTHKVMTALVLVTFFFGLARTDVNVTFKVWLWSFLCHFTDPWLCILQIEQWCRTAYSVIMFGTWCCGTLAFQPAQIAGCKTTIIATPPRKDGSLCPVSSLQFITKNPFQFIQHFVHTNWIINLRILAQPELLIVWRFELQVPLMAKG